MNGNFYQNPTFPANNYASAQEEIILERKTLEKEDLKSNTFLDILKNNKGKKIKVKIPKLDDKTYEGIIENVSDDYLIIRDNLNNTWYLINNTKLYVVEFLEEINY